MTDEPFTVDGQPPRQARTNGLSAPAWVALRELDPRFATPILDALRDIDVAAYVAPADVRRGLALEVQLPSTPTDRLWVDARRRDEAGRLVDTTLPGLEAGFADDDWAAIVAMFEKGRAEEPTWPASEDIDDRDTPAPMTFTVERSRGFGEDDEDHFIPPDPGPAPPMPTAQRYGWMALIGGVALLVLPTLLGDSLGSEWAYIALASIIGGFATLVYQMKDSPPDDSGPDDGAVV